MLWSGLWVTNNVMWAAGTAMDRPLFKRPVGEYNVCVCVRRVGRRGVKDSSLVDLALLQKWDISHFCTLTVKHCMTHHIDYTLLIILEGHLLEYICTLEWTDPGQNNYMCTLWWTVSWSFNKRKHLSTQLSLVILRQNCDAWGGTTIYTR